jgi:hypothetical protein
MHARRFTAYVEIPYDESETDFFYSSPLAEGWKVDRFVLCTLESSPAATGI